jgi:hypothetical protein
MSKVFVVEAGEDGVSGTARSVHSTVEGASAAAVRVRCAFAEGWKPVAIEHDELNRWEAGCDYVVVREMELDPPLLQTDEEFWNSLTDAQQVEAAAIGESVPKTRTVDVARILFIARRK